MKATLIKLSVVYTEIEILDQISCCLLKYRNTPCPVTNKTPSELIFRNQPRTLLSLLRGKKLKTVTFDLENEGIGINDNQQCSFETKNNPIKNDRNENKKKVSEFKNNEKILYRLVHKNYAHWAIAMVVKRLSTYICLSHQH